MIVGSCGECKGDFGVSENASFGLCVNKLWIFKVGVRINVPKIDPMLSRSEQKRSCTFWARRGSVGDGCANRSRFGVVIWNQIASEITCQKSTLILPITFSQGNIRGGVSWAVNGDTTVAPLQTSCWRGASQLNSRYCKQLQDIFHTLRTHELAHAAAPNGCTQNFADRGTWTIPWRKPMSTSHNQSIARCIH